MSDETEGKKTPPKKPASQPAAPAAAASAPKAPAEAPAKKGYWDRVMWEPIQDWFPYGAVAGIVGGFAVLMAIGPFGVINSTDIYQAGYRGTGMNTIYESEAYKAAMATIDEIPPSDPPYEVEADAPLAKDIYENVQVLGHLSEDNFLRLMTAITEWVAPEAGCEYCHTAEGFANDDLYTKVVSRRMIQMTQTINSEWQSHVAQTGVNCWTCHRGNNVPQYIWFNEEPKTAGALGYSNNQNRSNMRASSTSLPSNTFERFLVNDDTIRVTPEGSLVDSTGLNTMDTEWTYSLMIHMSSSLNVNCAYCHNTRAFNDWAQSPPARTTAWYGIRLVRELNNAYLDPLQPVYPDYRLGPTGDAPKANCTTCHQGVYKPLFGEPMIVDWPELAAPGPQAADQQAALAD
jgi:photosynthetic reaction center cytochrome c subunit